MGAGLSSGCCTLIGCCCREKIRIERARERDEQERETGEGGGRASLLNSLSRGRKRSSPDGGILLQDEDDNKKRRRRRRRRRVGVKLEDKENHN